MLRPGQPVAVVGAVGLIVVLSLNWFDVAPDSPLDVAHRSGWATLSWLQTLLVVLTLAATVFWLLASLAPDTPPLRFAPDEVTLLLALGTTLALAARLVFPPEHLDVLPAAFLGPFFAAVTAAGAWRSISADVSGASP